MCYDDRMLEEENAFGPFALDRRRHVVTRNGEAVPIGQRGYVLLETLLDAGGAAVDKSTLIERAWPGTIVEEGNLTTQIATLRKVLGHEAEALIVTVPRVGYRLIAQSAHHIPSVAGPPLIAVLPFADLSGDTNQGYFADGVVEDIITALSRFKNFGVLSRGSTFALKGAPGDPRVLAAEMGIRYALEGSVRRAGERVRVAARLVEAKTGVQLWGDRFDGVFADIFDFQDQITESVVGVVEPEIQKAEINRSRRKPPESLDAYDLFLQALPLVQDVDPDGYVAAIEMMQKAVALDAGFAPASAFAAWAYEKRISLGLPPLTSNDKEAAVGLARNSLAIGGDDPLVCAVSGWVLLHLIADPTGRDALFRAVEANPNNSLILFLAGVGYGHVGKLDPAYDCFLRAHRLSPGAADAYGPMEGLGAIEVGRGNYEAGIDWLQQSLVISKEWFLTYVILAGAYANVDRMEEAAAAIDKLRTIAPEIASIEGLLVTVGRDNSSFLPLLVPALRKAGLPEK
jgi:TolB-like protein/tetratricopeptide (TPR) repeat protein